MSGNQMGTNIAKALVEISKELLLVEENAVNPFHKAKYADLRAILEKAKPICRKHGVAIWQSPTSENGLVGVRTMLIHSSGEYVADRVVVEVKPTKGQYIQDVGSYITYLRRYSLAAMLGLATGEIDPDAVSPQPAPKKKVTKANEIKAGLLKLSKESTDAGISTGKTGVLVGLLNTSFGGDNGRKAFLKWLYGVNSIKDVEPAYQNALMRWLDADDGVPVQRALDSIKTIREELKL